MSVREDIRHFAAREYVRYFAIFTEPSVADPAWFEVCMETTDGRRKSYGSFDELKKLIADVEQQRHGSARVDTEDNFLVKALVESNELLQETVHRYRRMIKMLRNINRNLRTQVNRAHANDEAFKDFCQFDDVYTDEGGLPESESSQTISHE